MSIINTNIAALRAQAGSRSAQAGLERAMERLSTGLRINSASDDAAGLAIAQRMTADVRGLGVAIRNASDGISMTQTAESAMGEITNMLQRMRELAVQASNGTISNSDRNALQVEVSQLINEIDNVASRTSFNGTKLLDGAVSRFALQTGSRQGETISFNIKSARTYDLGAGEAPGLTATGSFEGTAADLSANWTMRSGDLIINGQTIGGSIISADNLSSEQKSASALAKAAAINQVSDKTGVRAVVGKTVMSGSAMTPAALTGTITINGKVSTSVSTTTDASTSRIAVVDAINAMSGETGVVAIDTGDEFKGVRLEAKDGRNIVVSLTTLTEAATGLRTGAQSGTFSLISTNGDSIEIKSSTTGNARLAGLAAGTYERGVSTFTTDARGVTSQADGSDVFVLTGQDLMINGTAIRATTAGDDIYSDDSAGSSRKAASGIAIANAINASSVQTGVTAKANAVRLNGATTTVIATTATATLVINGVSMDITLDQNHTAQETRANVVRQINSFSGLHGVVASDESLGGISLVAGDGRNVSIWFDSDEAAAANFGLADMTVQDTGAGYTALGVTNPASIATAAINTAYSSVTLSSAKSIDVQTGSAGFNTVSNFNGLGFEEGSLGADSGGLKVRDISIATQEGSTQALTAIDLALDQLSVNRAEIGSVQNRLEATINNLNSMSTNTVAARSRIQDADFALETTALARAQILSQAATAMLAQANQSKQSVLTLLR